jgi:hypothetical protein
LITDGKGDSLVYSQNGQVMGIKEYRATGGNAALLKDYHRKSDSLAQWKINFLPDTATQIYGFDYLGSGNHGIYSGSEYYPSVNGYDFRYKSVECYKTDKVVVDFGSYPEKDSVIFKDKYGVTLKLSKGNVLNFTGVAKPDTNYIYAYRGDQKVGKLMLNVYKRKPIKVCLVMVNGAHHKESFAEIKKYLDKVYKPAVVEFEIFSANFKMPELTSFSHGGSPWNSVYNDDQKRVLRAYNDSIKDGIYYLFFIDNVTDKKDGNGTMVSGYMPRGYNAGFIYDGGSAHTIAHELGHGIAGLEHVFSDSKSSGKTNNLVDYSEGEELWHFQWDEIQDPSRVWMKWNKDEEEGENIGYKNIYDYAFMFFYNQLDFGKNLVYYRLESKETNYTNRTWLTKGILNCYPGNIVFSGNVPYLYFDGEKHPIDIKDSIIYRFNFKQNELYQSISNTLNFNFIIFQNQSNDICLMNFDFIYDEDQKLWADLIFNCIGTQPCTCGFENPYKISTNIDEVYDILKKLSGFAKENQEFQYVASDGKAYRLNDGQVEESKLLDKDITRGNFTGKDLIVRFNNRNGYWQVSALGLNNSLPVANVADNQLYNKINGIQEQKEVDFETLSKKLAESTNKELLKRKLSDLDAKFSTISSNQFPSGQDFEIAEDEAFLSIVAEGWDMAKKLVTTGSFDKKYYSDGVSESSIKIPGEVTGGVEGGVSAVTDITSLVAISYDCIVDEDVRKEMCDGFKSLGDKIAEDPLKEIPMILLDIFTSSFTGLSPNEIGQMATTDDNGLRWHLIAKFSVVSTVSVIEIFVTGGAAKAGSVATKTSKISNATVLSQTASKQCIRQITSDARRYLHSLHIQKKFGDKIDDILGKLKADKLETQFYDDFVHIKVDELEDFLKSDLYSTWREAKNAQIPNKWTSDLNRLKILKKENPQVLSKFIADMKQKFSGFFDDTKFDDLHFTVKLKEGSDILDKIDLKKCNKDFSKLVSQDDFSRYVKQSKKLDENAVKGFLGDFSHFDNKHTVEEIEEKSFSFVQNAEQRKALSALAAKHIAKGWAKKKVRDFVTAWVQEFMAQAVLYPAKKYIIGDNSVNRQDFITYMFSSEVLESCTRNAFNSVIKGKNKWGNFFCDCITAESFSQWEQLIFPDDANGNEQAADVIKRNNIVDMVVACVINQFNTDGKFLKTLLVQIGKDLGTETVQDFIKYFFNNH